MWWACGGLYFFILFSLSHLWGADTISFHPPRKETPPPPARNGHGGASSPPPSHWGRVLQPRPLLPPTSSFTATTSLSHAPISPGEDTQAFLLPFLPCPGPCAGQGNQKSVAGPNRLLCSLIPPPTPPCPRSLLKEPALMTTTRDFKTHQPKNPKTHFRLLASRTARE